MVVKHRNLQRLGLGIETPLKERQCSGCKEFFTSQGLKMHQSIKKNRNCWRAGYLERRNNWIKTKLDYQKSWKKKQDKPQESVFEKHQKGKPFSKEMKQLVLNVYQSLVDDGIAVNNAITKAARMSGVSRRSMARFIKEKIGTGTLRGNR